MHDNNPENNQPPNRDAGNLMLGPQQKKSRLPEMTVNIVDDDIPEAYDDMLKAYHGSFKNLTEGDVVRGRVLSVSDTQVTVDIGYKSEGIISIQEFLDETGKPCVQPGQEVDVYLEQTEDQNGYILLSREKAERMKVWEDIEKAYRDNTVVTGRVIERIKGGLAVDIGVRAFLPGSQIDVRPLRNLDSLRGEELRMKVIKVNKRRGNIVLSRKVVLEEELERDKKRTLETLEEGSVVEGTVKNITDYGAFIDLGGVDGLLHITDISWGRVNHPSEVFAIGDKVKVKVIKFDRAEGRVSLGYKQLSEDPWLSASMRYPKNARVKGKVVSLTDYGAFVELEHGIEGLIHISEMTWNKRIKHPSKILTINDMLEAQVLEIDTDARRISLGLKQTEPNPWHTIIEKYAVGSIISGRVRNITDFGAFIEIEEGIDGLVHVSDISATKRIKHPSEVLKKGDLVEAKILSIETENQKLSLSMKDLEPDRWEEFFAAHRVGDIVSGKVVRTTNFGAFVQLQEGIEGLCHISELDEKHVEKSEEILQVGQDVEMRIIKVNPAEKKIGLSLKAMKDESFRESLAALEAIDSSSAGMTVGDRVGDQLKQMMGLRRNKEPQE
jgi:small subunit ribosomal protein S1